MPAPDRSLSGGGGTRVRSNNKVELQNGVYDGEIIDVWQRKTDKEGRYVKCFCKDLSVASHQCGAEMEMVKWTVKLLSFDAILDLDVRMKFGEKAIYPKVLAWFGIPADRMETFDPIKTKSEKVDVTITFSWKTGGEKSKSPGQQYPYSLITHMRPLNMAKVQPVAALANPSSDERAAADQAQRMNAAENDVEQKKKVLKEIYVLLGIKAGTPEATSLDTMNDVRDKIALFNRAYVDTSKGLGQFTLTQLAVYVSELRKDAARASVESPANTPAPSAAPAAAPRTAQAAVAAAPAAGTISVTTRSIIEVRVEKALASGVATAGDIEDLVNEHVASGDLASATPAEGSALAAALKNILAIAS